MSLSQRREDPLAPLRREDGGGVATLTLQSPASRNALSLATIEALIDAFAAIDRDPATRVVVLAGEGPALSAGHDLKELQAHRNDADRGRAFFERVMARCAELMRAVVALPKPVVAAVEGVATAAGCQLVAACDLAVAGADARFALPGVSIGLFCSTPLVAVGRAVSRKHAMEMALSGDLYDAQTAERFGLVNRVVPAGAALAEARALAQRIAARSAATLAIGKRAFYRQVDLPLDEAYALAGRAMVENLLCADSAEGVAAFLDKRPPRWEDA
jgi:enoyl-CoA hydratase/carnithine racemase